MAGEAGHDPGRLRLIEAAMDQASDAVLIIDAGPLTDDSPQMIYVNAQFERLTGFSSKEALGRTPLLLRHRETDRSAIRAFQVAYEARERATIELAIGRRDGTPFYVEMSLTPLAQDDGRVTNWIGILRDITERRRSQAALVERSRIEAVARLAAGVAHDFNNMLTVIASSAELARWELEPGHPAEAYLAGIEVAADRARTHTGQLLAVSKRNPAQAEIVDVCAAVGAARAGLERVAGGAVRVRIAAPPGPLLCRIDAQQLEQALASLVANARDAQPGGGEVRVDVSRAGTHVVIAVEDDGPGLPEHAAARAFEPFWSTKPLGSGAGLGLPTVRWVAARGGGSVRIERALSGGARLVVELPLATADTPTLDRGSGALAENDAP